MNLDSFERGYKIGLDEGHRKGFEKGRHAEAPKMFIGGIIVGGIATIWAYLLLN